MRRVFNAIVLTATILILNQAAAQPPVVDPASFREFSLQQGNVYAKSAKLAQWVQEQNDRTRKLLDAHPLMPSIKARFAELAPTNPPAVYSFGGGDVWVKAGSLVIANGGVETVLVDKASLAGAVVMEARVSPDGTKIAYAVATGGSDSNYWSVYSLETKQTLADAPIRARIYEINWASDSSGFFYSVWPSLDDEFKLVAQRTERTTGPAVAFHKIGDEVAEDEVVFENPFKGAPYSVSDIPGTSMLVANRVKLSGFNYRASVLIGARDASGEYQWTNLTTDGESLGRLVALSKDWVYVLTSKLGNGYGILGYSVANPKLQKTIVPAGNDIIMQAQQIANTIVAMVVSAKLQTSLRVYDLSGKLLLDTPLTSLGLPALGILSLPFAGGPYSTKASFMYSATDKAPVTISFDPQTLKFTVLKSAKEVPFDGTRVVSSFQTFKASDGEMIPLQLFSRKDSSAPAFVYLTYYGSNGAVFPSAFNRKFQLMLELGGVVAIVSPRGGGEGGARWYKIGMQDRTRTIDDVVESAHWLRQHYKNPRLKIAAAGRSYGGMLTNAVMTRASEVFDLFIPTVGIADLSYYMTDYFGSLGWDDLGFGRDHVGQIIDSPAARQKLADWSPIENLHRMKELGAAILFTADTDERTGPHQTYLLTAALQKQFPSSPVYMFEAKGGHNARAEMVDEAVFTAIQFGVKNFNPLK